MYLNFHHNFKLKRCKCSIFCDTMPCTPMKVNRPKMEATCSFEIFVDFQRTTRRYIPEDITLHNHLYENLKCLKNVNLNFAFNRVLLDKRKILVQRKNLYNITEDGHMWPQHIVFIT
jgi:hypothetical protein